MKAGGEQYVQSVNEARLNTDLAGYAQLFGAGQQTEAGGINMTLGTLGSAMAEGGAFNQGGGGQTGGNGNFSVSSNPIPSFKEYSPASLGSSQQGLASVSLRPQQLIR